MPWHPDRQPFDVLLEGRAVVRYWGPTAGRILRIRAGDRLQHRGRIFDGPGHWAAVVQRPAQWHDAIATHTPVGRLQSHQAAIGCRSADRATRTGPQRTHAEPRCHRGARPAARTTRDMGEIPGVASQWKATRWIRATQGKFVHGELA